MDRNDPALGPEAKRQIEAAWAQEQVAVSAISFWEIAMLAERGRIQLPMPITLWREDWLRAGLIEIAVDGRIGLLSTQLGDLHKDPADRIIIATAIVSNTPLVTADRLILDWQGQLERIAADA